MHKKHLLIIATGGTIASRRISRGLTPTLSGHELTACVPQLQELAHISVLELMNIDSTNMLPAHWLKIAQAIQDNYDNFDGFVILHGTDTMAYTASALSYLIQHSAKPIVLTGSQQPMTSAFTDAKLNLYQACLVCASGSFLDVCVVFSGNVICGTRAYKQKTMSYNAFCSINIPPLAVIRNRKIICNGQDISSIEAKKPQEPPKFFRALNTRVMCLRLTPGLSPSIFSHLQDDFDAIILETFGIGGIPNTPTHSLVDALKAWMDIGKILVLTTQVAEEGLDLGVYEVGHAFLDNKQVLRGDDMTTEALLAKTMWVLAQAKTQEERARLFYTPINHDRMESHLDI